MSGMGDSIQKPAISRDVHYIQPSDVPGMGATRGQHIAAKVTAVNELDGETVVDLVLFYPEGIAHVLNVSQQIDGVYSYGSWHWPERV